MKLAERAVHAEADARVFVWDELQRDFPSEARRAESKFWCCDYHLTVVAEWIHFTLFEIILPTVKRKVCTFGGL